MANIVFGVGASHSPLLAIKPEQWPLRAEDDRRNPGHYYRGRKFSFDELANLRKNEAFNQQLTLEVMRERDRRNQQHLDRLGRMIRDANLDVLVIFGDDQHEILLSDNNPAFLVFTGEKIPFMPTTKERFDHMTPAIRLADWARTPAEAMLLKGAPELGRHVVSSVVRDGFDVSVSERVLPKPGGENGIGHAFGFFWHRLLGDLKEVPDMATLPIFINTFFPPNQPSARRVLEFGRAVGHAIRSWKKGIRVGIAASGGFSHFVIDEELDKRLIDAIAGRDDATITAEPEANYQSGTSEIKNWIAAMGATEGTGLEFTLLDYIPCYRSEAGTGNAMAFALWS
jgi:OH-DDVA oxygenase